MNFIICHTQNKSVLINSNFTNEFCKVIDKEARAHVDQALEEAKSSPEPPLDEFWTEIYVEGTEPPVVRGCDPEELVGINYLVFFFTSSWY